MRAASPGKSTYLQRVPLRRRVAALLLALLAQGLILLMLLRLAPETFGLPRPDRPMTTIDLLPGRQAAATEKAAAAPKQASTTSAARAAPKAAIIVPPAPPNLPPRPLNMVEVSRDVMVAGDIAALPSHRGDQMAASGAGDGGGSSAGDSPLAGGSGPGGEKLYKAEWQREPTHAELAFYVKNRAPDGAWAVIACRTVAGYRVEDCAQLGDSPQGSGLARSIVQAAWQFRVKPPRVGGHSLVGAWVSIRIDFSVRGDGG